MKRKSIIKKIIDKQLELGGYNETYSAEKDYSNYTIKEAQRVSWLNWCLVMLMTDHKLSKKMALKEIENIATTYGFNVTDRFCYKHTLLRISDGKIHTGSHIMSIKYGDDGEMMMTNGLKRDAYFFISNGEDLNKGWITTKVLDIKKINETTTEFKTVNSDYVLTLNSNQPVN